MKSKVFAFGAALLAMCASASANAAVVYDFSVPTTVPGASLWGNSTGSQNFLMKFTLSSATSVDGITIWSGEPFASTPQALTVKIRDDVSGLPALTNLFSFSLPGATSIVGNADGTSQVTASFAPTLLSAGSYWIGLSGSSELSQASYNYGPISSPDQYQLSQDTLQFAPFIHALPFLVLGTESVAAVPEPASWALMIMGIGVLGLGLRRKPGMALRISRA